MDSLAKTLYSAVTAAIEQYISRLNSELGVDKERALAVWNQSAGSDLTATSSSAAAPAKKSTKKGGSKKEASTKADDDDTKKCQYRKARGDNKGELCGSKVSDESTSGFYCKKHLKQEGKTAKSTKSESTGSTAPKKSKGKKSEQKESESAAVQALGNATDNTFTIRKNQFGNYEHPGTHFVFDQASRDVIGKQSPDNTITPLTAEDITQCKNLNFGYKLPGNITSDGDREADISEDEIQDSEFEDENENENDDDN